MTVSESWLEYWPGPVSGPGTLGLGEPGRYDVICLLLESSSRSDGQPVWVGGGRVELGEPVGNAHHGLELSGGEQDSQLFLQGGDVTATADFGQPGGDVPVFRLGVGDGLVVGGRAGPVLFLFGAAALFVAEGQPRVLVGLLYFPVGGQLAVQCRQLGDDWLPVTGRPRRPVCSPAPPPAAVSAAGRPRRPGRRQDK